MILCVVEHDGGVPRAESLQALDFSARSIGGALHAVAFGPGAEAVAGAAGHHGASVVHVACVDLETYAPRAWAHAIVDLCAETGPEAIVGPGSDRGNELLAYVAAMTDLPMAANCTEVVPGDPYRISRLRWAGSLVEDATLGGGSPKLVTVATSAAGEIFPGPEVQAEVRKVDSPCDERDLRVVVSECLEPAGQGVSLTEARVVVGGGRGVGSAEGFAVLEELAGLLGGAVGASRVVTSEGWRSHRDQVGQTGTRISPELYIACGISGAIQHMAGCRSARRILAINRDAEAPIMAKADYVVVGDLHAVLPAIVEEVHRRPSSGKRGHGHR